METIQEQFLGFSGCHNRVHGEDTAKLVKNTMAELGLDMTTCRASAMTVLAIRLAESRGQLQEYAMCMSTAAHIPGPLCSPVSRGSVYQEYDGDNAWDLQILPSSHQRERVSWLWRSKNCVLNLHTCSWRAFPGWGGFSAWIPWRSWWNCWMLWSKPYMTWRATKPALGMPSLQPKPMALIMLCSPSTSCSHREPSGRH